MRTTLDIDDDVLAAAKELARREHKTAGQVVSRLLRDALTRPAPAAGETTAREPEAFYGFRPFASRGTPVTNDLVERLRDEEGL